MKLPVTQLDAVLKLQIALSEFLEFIEKPGNGFDSETIRLAKINLAMMSSIRNEFDTSVQVIHMITGLMAARDTLKTLLGRVEIE